MPGNRTTPTSPTRAGFQRGGYETQTPAQTDPAPAEAAGRPGEAGQEDAAREPHDCSAGVLSGSAATSAPSTLDKLKKPPQNGSRERGESPENDPAEARERMAKRRQAKRATLELVKRLDELESPVPYERAFSCCERIDQEDGQLTSKYCNSRWCVVCNRIRTGRHVNNQLPVVRSWEDSHLVTLTVPNLAWGGGSKAAGRLRSCYEEMLRRFNLAKRSINRKHGLDFRALRSFEVVWNEEREELNTHWHVVVPSAEIAEALVEEWMARCSEASRAAQDVRPMGDAESDLLEVCKYVTKIIGGTEGEPAYPIEVLDAIFRGLKGKHLTQSIGYSPEEFGGDDDRQIEEMEDLEHRMTAFRRPGEDLEWNWEEDVGDWVDRKTGEMLTEALEEEPRGP